MTLTWTPPAPSPEAVSAYQVQDTQGHSPATCGIWGPPINEGTARTATITGLVEDATYCFRVGAVYTNGTTLDSAWLTDAETLGPPGQAVNALDSTTVVSTQRFSVAFGQFMLATVSSFGSLRATPTLTTQNGQVFTLVTSYQNAEDSELWTYVLGVVANLNTSTEVVTLTDQYTSQYMLGIVSYSGYTGVTSVGTWVPSGSTSDTANVTTVSGATLVACIGYVTEVGGASFSPGYVDATWAAATTNSRADEWYALGGASNGTNFATVTRGLGGVTSMVLLALWSSSSEGVPGAPTGLSEVSATTSSLTLKWTAPAPPSGTLTGYEVRYTQGHSPATCGIWGAPIGEGTGLNATITGLSEDTTYCFQVDAVYSDGTFLSSAWLTDAETLGPPGQATNALDDTTVVSTQIFSVTSGQLMLATVSSYGALSATPTLTTQNSQTFTLVASYQNTVNTALWTYVFDVVANLTTSSEVVTLTDTVASEYMLGIVSYSGYTGVTTIGAWVTSTGISDTANVTTVAGATLAACIGYVTDVGGASFSSGYVDATWAAATTNSRADQWYALDGAASGVNFGTVTRGLGGVTSMILLALT